MDLHRPTSHKISGQGDAERNRRRRPLLEQDPLEVDPMPRLVSFMLTRLSIGFALGIATALAIWSNGFPAISGSHGHHDFVALCLFVYGFGSSIALGYLATALVLEIES
jgi:hypothetical protein